MFFRRRKGYIYTRIGNPNIEELEKAVAELENGFGGIAASSGMAAVNIVYLTLLGQGDHMISHNAVTALRGELWRIYIQSLE